MGAFDDYLSGDSGAPPPDPWADANLPPSPSQATEEPLWSRALETVTYPLTLPKRGIDWLARTGAGALGMPQPEDMTTGRMVRNIFGIGQEQLAAEEPDSHLWRLAGRGAELGTDLLTDPLTWALGGSYGLGKDVTAGLEAAKALEAGGLTAEAAQTAMQAVRAGKLAANVERGAAAAFAPGMLAGAAREGGRAWDEYQRHGWTPEVTDEATGALLSAVLGGLGARHALHAPEGFNIPEAPAPRDVAPVDAAPVDVGPEMVPGDANAWHGPGFTPEAEFARVRAATPKGGGFDWLTSMAEAAGTPEEALAEAVANNITSPAAPRLGRTAAGLGEYFNLSPEARAAAEIESRLPPPPPGRPQPREVQGPFIGSEMQGPVAPEAQGPLIGGEFDAQGPVIPEGLGPTRGTELQRPSLPIGRQVENLIRSGVDRAGLWRALETMADLPGTPEEALGQAVAENISTPGAPRLGRGAPTPGLGGEFGLSPAARAAAGVEAATPTPTGERVPFVPKVKKEGFDALTFEQKDNVRKTALALAQQILSDQTGLPVGRFPEMDLQGKPTGKWYGNKSHRARTPFKDLKYTSTEMVRILQRAIASGKDGVAARKMYDAVIAHDPELQAYLEREPVVPEARAASIEPEAEPAFLTEGEGPGDATLSPDAPDAERAPKPPVDAKVMAEAIRRAEDAKKLRVELAKTGTEGGGSDWPAIVAEAPAPKASVPEAVEAAPQMQGPPAPKEQWTPKQNDMMQKAAVDLARRSLSPEREGIGLEHPKQLVPHLIGEFGKRSLVAATDIVERAAKIVDGITWDKERYGLKEAFNPNSGPLEAPADITSRVPDFERDGVKQWVARFDADGNELARDAAPVNGSSEGERLISWAQDPKTGKLVKAGGITNLQGEMHYLTHNRRLGDHALPTNFEKLRDIGFELGWKKATETDATSPWAHDSFQNRLAKEKAAADIPSGGKNAENAGAVGEGPQAGPGAGRGPLQEASRGDDGNRPPGGREAGDDVLQVAEGARAEGLPREVETETGGAQPPRPPGGKRALEAEAPLPEGPPEPPQTPEERAGLARELFGDGGEDRAALERKFGGRSLPPKPPGGGATAGAPTTLGGSTRQGINAWHRLALPFIENVKKVPVLGPKIADIITAGKREWETNASQQVHDYMKTIRGLSDAEWKDVQAGLEGAEAKSPKVAGAVKAIRAILDDVAQRADKAGVFIDYTKDYFPHFGEDGRWSFEEMVRKRAADKGVSEGEAAAELHQARRMGEFTMDRKNASLERQRTGELADYRKDKGVLVDYLVEANRRIAEANHYGPRLEKLKGVVDRIGNQGDHGYVWKGIERMTGREGPLPGAKLGGALRGIEGVTKLGTGPISQLGSIVQTIYEGGARNTGKALIESIRKYGDAELEAIRSGAAFPNLGEEGQTLTGAPKSWTQKLPYLRGTQFVDKFMRVVADKTAQNLIPALHEKAAKGDARSAAALKDLGIDATKPLTDEALLAGRKNFAERTQYRTDLTQTPLWATTPLGRVATQFLHFGYQQTRFINRAVSEAISGRPKPLSRYLATMAAAGLVGEVGNDLKAIVKGYGVQGEDPDSWEDVLSSKRVRADLNNPKSLLMRFVQNSIFAGLGLYQTAVERATSSRNPVDLVGGPVIGDVYALSDKLLKGDMAGVGKEVVRRGVPYFGNQFVQEFGRSEQDIKEKGDRPAVPGWVGRVRDAATGKTSVGDMLARGLFTGGPGTPDREEIARLEKLHQANRETKAALEAQYPGLAKTKDKTLTEKVGAEKRAALRMKYVRQMVAAFDQGNKGLARAIARRARRDGFTFGKDVLRNLEAAAMFDDAEEE